MKRCIIFGTGNLAKESYWKLKEIYDITYFTNNDFNTWGELFFDKLIISIDKLKELINNDYIIIIASMYYHEIAEQLILMGISEFLYINPVSMLLSNYKYSKCEITQNISKIKSVLFVQESQCIRTYKIASVLAKKGIKVDLAFVKKHPELTYSNTILPYKNIIPINNLLEFLNFVDDQDYNLIHCSNEPDYLTVFLLNSNKKVIHDTHDLMSLRGDINNSELINEYNANKNSHANIYVTNKVKSIATDKFHIHNKNILVLNNYILESQKPKYHLEKLSKKDGQIHCVYEGGLSKNLYNHRFLENKFLEIASNKIHVHFYSPCDLEYCKEFELKSEFLHYEGAIDSQKLMTELTKYDIGLALLNINFRNNMFLQTTFPNKIFEYLNANLPVAVDDIEVMKEFVNKYDIGKYLNFDDDIKEQLAKIAQINIEKDFLVKNNLTMDSQVDNILDFYSKTL